MCAALPQNYYLLGKRKHRHPEGVSLVEEAVRPSRKWVFTLLVEGPQRSLGQEELNTRQLPHYLLVNVFFCFLLLGSNPKSCAS